MLFRSDNCIAAQAHDPFGATATVVTNAFAELGIEKALGPYRGYVNVDRNFLFSEAIEFLPSHAVTVELLESIEPDDLVVTRVAELREKGFCFALDDVTSLEGACEAILPHIDVVKVDVPSVGEEALDHIVGRCKSQGIQLLAEKIESPDQANYYCDRGFDLFQGYFFARPTIISGRKLGHSRLAILNLVALLMEDADTTRIEQAFKAEPGLTLNLLRLTNAAAKGMQTRIESISHAISVMGRRQLQRWLEILLYSNPSEGSSPLLQIAATRARLMELLAQRIALGAKPLSDQAFMTGILSLTPALLGEPIEDILRHLPVAPAVADALTGERKGTLGGLLDIAEASETSDLYDHQRISEVFGNIAPSEYNLALASSIAWANSIDSRCDTRSTD